MSICVKERRSTEVQWGLLDFAFSHLSSAYIALHCTALLHAVQCNVCVFS